MNLYDDATVAASLPATPVASAAPGYFTDGQPGVTPRSIIRAWIMNLIQMEIVNTIAGAGLTPSRADATQLLQSIQILAVGTPATTATRGAVVLASDADALTGTDAAKAITPHALQAKINALVNSAPGALDTLKELADALADDPHFATTITNALALKAPLASPALTGAPTSTAPATGDASSRIAVTSQVAASVQASSYTYGADSSGAANTVTVALTPALAAYAAGESFKIKIANSNTGASTVNINGLGSKAIQWNGRALVGGELVANQIVDLIYDGTAFQIRGLASIAGSNTHGEWQVFQDGTIRQSGFYGSAIASEGPINVVFPIPFPTACAGVLASSINSSSSNSGNATMQPVSWTTTGAIVYAQGDGGGTAPASDCRWSANGK